MSAKSKKKATRRKRPGPAAGRAPAPRRNGRSTTAARKLTTTISTYHEELLIQNEHLQEMQAELEKSRDRYAMLYNEAPVGYVTLDRNGIMEATNLTAARLLNAKKDYLLGRPLLPFVHQEDRADFLNFLLACRGDARTSRHWVEVRLQRRLGGYAHVQITSVGVSRESSGGTVYLTALTDISGRVEIEQARLKAEEQVNEALRERSRAQAASDAKDQFLAIVSHELRTPLSAILLWTKLLQSGSLTDMKQLREALNAINTSAEAQKELIEDLLDMSRITTGKLRLEMREVELVPVVHDALSTLEPAAEAKRLIVTAELDPEVGIVRADPDRLRQVVWNLLSNAVKFTPAGGLVRIVLKREQSEVDICVSDSGMGIDPEFLPHVFDSFTQADPTASRSQGGIGVGLAIVKRLVELHGGTVSGESAGLGRGATFTVRLPLLDLSRPQSLPDVARSMDAAAKFAGLAGRSVLVVEDDPHTRGAMAALLRNAGLRVTEAQSAARALESFARSRPDLLISDIGLPGMDGYAFIRQVRTQESKEHNPPVPAIALTAFCRETDRQLTISAGFQKHLGKPIDATQLLPAMAELLKD